MSSAVLSNLLKRYLQLYVSSHADTGYTRHVAEPAYTSYGIKAGGGGGVEIVSGVDRRELQGPLKKADKRAFAAPKIPVPVERRRQRALEPGDENRVPTIPAMNNGLLPLEQITDRQIAAADMDADSPGMPLNAESVAHSVTASDRVQTCQQQRPEWPAHTACTQHQKLRNQCGFFRQILSEEDAQPRQSLAGTASGGRGHLHGAVSALEEGEKYTLMHYPYSEVISTRKVKSEEGPLSLDMKCGNLMQQRVTRIQTDQAHEISRLIRQQSVKEEST